MDFGTVVIVIAVAAAVVAALSWRAGEYDRIGESDLLLERETGGARPGAGDPGLRDEVRQLVIARNERRARRGEPPLDVETEVERQLRAMDG